MDIRAQDICFVIGAGGKPTAVLVDISTWERILAVLEDAEDVAAKDALAALNTARGELGKSDVVSVRWMTPNSNPEAESPREVPVWDELVLLGQQISQGWQSKQTSVEILSSMRR